MSPSFWTNVGATAKAVITVVINVVFLLEIFFKSLIFVNDPSVVN